MEELIEQIARRGAPVPIVAAMAHLNLAMIHPFSEPLSMRSGSKSPPWVGG